MARNGPVRRAGEIFVCRYRANLRRLRSPEVGRAGIEECNNFFVRREERSVSEIRKRRNIFCALDAGEFFVELDGHISKVSRESQIKAGDWDKKRPEKYLLYLCTKN